MADQSQVEVRRDDDQSRYVAEIDGQHAGICQYRDEVDTRTFTHTVVDEAFEGRGVGSALARAALDGARADGKVVVAQCSFIQNYLGKHDEWNDILA